MLSSRELQRGRGGCHESTTRGTGPGDPWAKRCGDDHRAGRRCGAAHWADGHDGFAGVLDRPLPRHWRQRRSSWGWTAVIWLAYILTEGDHRKVSVETYLKGMYHTLSRLTAQVIE